MNEYIILWLKPGQKHFSECMSLIRGNDYGI